MSIKTSILSFFKGTPDPDILDIDATYDERYENWLSYLGEGGSTAMWEAVNGKLEDPPYVEDGEKENNQ